MKDLVLDEDTRVTVGPHKLVIAELQQQVTVTPRAPTDYSHGYTDLFGEADVERIARALSAAFEAGATAERAGKAEAFDDYRYLNRDAALLLSKLHAFKLGAPPESPGHAYARRVFEEVSTPASLEGPPPPR